MNLHVWELNNRGVFRVSNQQGHIVVASTQTPLCSAARVLLASGAVTPDTVLVKLVGGAESQRGAAGRLAALTVQEGNRRPHLAAYRPMGDAHGSR